MPTFQVEPCRSEYCPGPSRLTTITVENTQDGVALAPYPLCAGCGLALETHCVEEE